MKVKLKVTDIYDAICFNGNNSEEIEQIIKNYNLPYEVLNYKSHIGIKKNQENPAYFYGYTQLGEIGDWIIFSKTYIDIVKSDQFEKRYEEVSVD